MTRARDDEFMQFVRDRSLALRRTAYLLCGSWADGDDLVQESLAKVYVAWPRISSSRAVESYTRTTMLRTYLNSRRKWGREITLAVVPERGVDDQDAALTVTLSALLRELPPRQRAALVLRFYQDLSVPQIAEELGIPEGTVKSQLSRGLAAMRTRLDDPDHPDDDTHDDDAQDKEVTS
ncbi:MAG: SigE family RNA polymerase sigma factor [Actinomycetota bacterium]|nr:SigE family RNA polymerase sigma factor [Actinomycetota bacterium]